MIDKHEWTDEVTYLTGRKLVLRLLEKHATGEWNLSKLSNFNQIFFNTKKKKKKYPIIDQS